MKKSNFVVIFLITCATSFGQWNKLPTQYISSYWPTPPGGANYTIQFPYSIFPVGDGHVFISAYYNNGSVSSPYSEIDLYETYDDFSSHRSVPNVGYLFYLYAKNDSNFIWFDNPGTNAYYRRLMHTSSDFLNTDTLPYCMPQAPPYTYTPPNSSITPHFVYSLFQGEAPYDDTLKVEKYSLTNSTLLCKQLYTYANGPLKFVNDSVGFISSSYLSNPSKKTLLKTMDYGQTWNEIYLDSVNTILDFSFFSADTGYMLLNNGSLLKTTVSGVWVNLLTDTSVKCFSFYDANTGYIGGNTGFLNKTSNGGQTWTSEISGTNHTITSIYTFANQVAYFKDSLSDLYKNTALIASIKTISVVNELKIYPNPGNDKLSIETNNASWQTLQVYDITGKLVLTQSINGNTTINTSALNEGVYNVSIISTNGVANKRLVIVR